MQLRAATLADLDVLVGFILAEAREAEGSEKSPERVVAGVRAGLLDPALARYWVLEGAQGELLGSISVVREWSDWHAGHYWWIQSLFIRPEQRGRGLLRQMLEHVRAVAVAEQALELRLYVHRDNERACRAYARAGFEPSSYVIMHRRLD